MLLQRFVFDPLIRPLSELQKATIHLFVGLGCPCRPTEALFHRIKGGFDIRGLGAPRLRHRACQVGRSIRLDQSSCEFGNDGGRKIADIRSNDAFFMMKGERRDAALRSPR